MAATLHVMSAIDNAGSGSGVEVNEDFIRHHADVAGPGYV
jgi:hypothetical protein